MPAPPGRNIQFVSAHSVMRARDANEGTEFGITAQIISNIAASAPVRKSPRMPRQPPTSSPSRQQDCHDGGLCLVAAPARVPVSLRVRVSAGRGSAPPTSWSTLGSLHPTVAPRHPPVPYLGLGCEIWEQLREVPNRKIRTAAGRCRERFSLIEKNNRGYWRTTRIGTCNAS
jgi:hypothetical protein